MRTTYTQTEQQAWGRRIGTGLRKLLGVAVLSAVASNAWCDDLERRQAKRIHDRLTGVPPSEAVLDRMEAELTSGGGSIAAAMIAIDGPNNPASKYFYNVTLKNFASPWTNRDQDVFVPLNDYSATVIGMVRDSAIVSFDQVLYGDILYKGADSLSASGVSGYSPASNAHYQDIEDLNLDLSDPGVLQRSVQSSQNGIPANATAGVMTSRAASEAFFIAGTNRAMFRFTLMNHMCTDLEPLKDTSLSPDRIRQDVSRSPGGDSRIFLNRCIGCHTGMDPMAQAFAYYDFDEATGRLVYTPGQPQPKYGINADNFRPGYITQDDSWDNYWRSGQNSVLGWGPEIPEGSRNGAKTLGQEFAGSQAFARCQGIKVYRTVCLSEPSETDLGDLMTASGFAANFNMKDLFAHAADACKGS